jgi:ABC-type ATPase with predicted acetyltransferase domain
MTEYRITRSFTSRTERSDRVLAIAEAFGLGLEERNFFVFNDLPVIIEPGDVVYIHGQSGSGKSQLLKALIESMRADGLKVADFDGVQFEDRALIDQIGKNTQEAIELLSRAGLNDAYLLIRKPSELSDGQRYRFRLAKLFESDADAWVADEFGAVLDRVTAKTVAFSAQKLARTRKKTLIVATTHEDLVTELGPSMSISKRFEERVTIIRHDAI